MSNEPPNDRTHYLCERCGGMGKQPEGTYNPDSKKYDGKAGTCIDCGGTGLLGPKYIPKGGK